MKFITRFKVSFRQWWRRRVAKRQMGPLREFVYLDEVSVYSLIASRLGPIAAEFTETQTASLQGEIEGSLAAGASIAKADVKSRILSNQTKGSQILRKATVQTTFKELYEYEMPSLALRPISESQVIPKIRSLDEIIDSSATSASNSNTWLIDPTNLVRGQLFELEVQLEADPVFRMSAMASAILEILEEDAETFGFDSDSDFAQLKSVGRILEKLLVGLVPVRGMALDYCVVEFKNKEWIISRRLLDELPNVDALHARSLYVVGVAEQALFWKDIRRILFSKAHFRVLCRMAQNGIQDSWTPVKLAHVFESAFPDLSNQLNFSGLAAIVKLNNDSEANLGTELKQQLIHDALVNYAKSLANHYQINITSQNLEQIGLLANQHTTSFSHHKGRHEAFESIASYLINSFSLEREPLILAQYRALALTDAGLDFSGNPSPSLISNNAISPATPQERFLDSEFVAIYW